jgi:hypothetical protein
MPGPFTRRNHSEDHRPGPDEDTDLVQDYALRLSISSIFEPEGTLLLTAIWRVLVCAIVAGRVDHGSVVPRACPSPVRMGSR